MSVSFENVLYFIVAEDSHGEKWVIDECFTAPLRKVLKYIADDKRGLWLAEYNKLPSKEAVESAKVFYRKRNAEGFTDRLSNLRLIEIHQKQEMIPVMKMEVE